MPFGHVACIPLLVRPDPYGEMFQNSTNRHPLFDRASTPTTSHPTLQAPATFTVTGIGPLSVSPETIGSPAYSIRAGGGDHVLRDEPL